MDIQALRYLVTLCETNSFSETADLHYISTSTCSRKIRSLEEEMGCTLFVRDSHNVEPTPAGMEMRDIARRMLSMIDHLNRKNLESQEGVYGQICLAMDPLDHGTEIEPYLKMFREQYPRIEVVFRSASIARIETGLLKHDFDVGVMIKPAAHVYELFDCIVLKTMGLMAYVHQDHPLARNGSVTLKELLDWEIVLFDRDRSPYTYDSMMEQLRGIISLTWICTVNHANMMKMMCAVNHCVGICFPFEMPDEREKFKALPIVDVPKAFEYVLAVKRGLKKAPVRAMCELVESTDKVLQNW